MSDWLDNGIVRTVLLTLLAVVVLGLFGWLKFRRDEQIVARFLKDSGIDSGDGGRTTREIAAATRLSEVRIRRVCRKSARIAKHRDEKETWRLS